MFPKPNYTIPYRYNVVKDDTSFRTLSLLHPASQIRVCDFYSKYENLMCYYTGISNFSIRRPEKIGTSYFFMVGFSDKNKYKNNSVDTTDIEMVTENPASYFSYYRFDRLYKFFKSNDYFNLERKFSSVTALDISKCFNSIYTHSVSWAVKDIYISKENTSNSFFGAEFDELMQKMNFNETNGICIGPEVSRIFAETILAKIDEDIEKSLLEHGLKAKSDYDIRRYVDNYYIFSNSNKNSDFIKLKISLKLKEYNLHLNEKKTERGFRPFYTKKSKVIDDVNRNLESFFEKFVSKAKSGIRKFSFPLKIYRNAALSKSFINDVKSSCYDSQVGYDMVSNYVISAIDRRLLNLIEGYELAIGLGHASSEDYVEAVVLLLDVAFFFYTVNPTVASSLKVARSIVLSAEFFSTSIPTQLEFLREHLVRAASHLFRSPTFNDLAKGHNAVPVEILNILIALREAAGAGGLQESFVNSVFSDAERLEYFSIVSGLFVLGDETRFSSLRDALVKRAKQIILQSRDIRKSSHDLHLALDILACPFILSSDRADLMVGLRKKLELATISKAKCISLIADLERTSWFISWRGVELLNLLTKKQLSAVY